MPKNTTQCPQPGLEPGPLAPESSTLTLSMSLENSHVHMSLLHVLALFTVKLASTCMQDSFVVSTRNSLKSMLGYIIMQMRKAKNEKGNCTHMYNRQMNKYCLSVVLLKIVDSKTET